MAGFIKLHRGWRDNPALNSPERRDAWLWLIENACWKPSRVRIKGDLIELERGELTFSLRYLADAWGWSKSKTDRFIAELRREGMIQTRSKIGTTAGHRAGQGQSIITICNYAKYQDREDGERDSDVSETETTAGQQRDKEEEGKEGKEERNTHYAFFGRTVKLNAADLDRWRKRYHGLSDIVAELGALDDWLDGQDEKTRKGWFHIVSGSLNKKHQAAIRSSGSDEPWEMPIC